MAKILVIRGGAIGDFILTLPVLSALKEQFPTAEIEVLGYSHIAALATEGQLARAVRPIDARPLAGFFARGGELDSGLQRYFAEFALIICFLYDPDEVFRTNVARCSRAQFIVGPHRPDEKAGLHATEVYLRPLERLAIFGSNPVPKLAIGDEKTGHSKDPRCIALHPGSGSPRKNWPEQNWRDLLLKLIRSGPEKLLVVGGEAEEGLLERLAAGLRETRLEVARSLPLPQLARRLQVCSAFVGHDSGISHLAAALGLPVLALWADTPETVWKPRGERVKVLKDSRGLAHLEIATVLAELRALLEVDD